MSNVLPVIPPIILKDGVYKYRTPWWICISLAYKVQYFEGFIQFFIEKHKVLSIKSFDVRSLPMSGVWYVFPGIRLKWDIECDVTVHEVSFKLEGHKIFTVTLEYLRHLSLP